MAVRLIPVVLIVLGACAPGFAEEPVLNRTLPPATELPPPTPAPAVTELPPFLAVPPPPCAPRRPCFPCPNDYHPAYVYLPDQNPDWGAGSCDGECRPCRMSWCNADFFCGKTRGLDGVNRRTSYGCRLGTGHWLDASRTVGAEIGLFDLHDSHHVEELGPTLVNSPITFTTLEANVRAEVLTFEGYRVDGLAGYRYARLHEELFIGNAAFVEDLDTKNHLHAVQVGAVGTYRYGAYFCEVLAKIGVGPNGQVLTRNGVRTTDDVVSAIGEFGTRAGYQIGDGCWFTIGYTLMYLTNMERPRDADTGFYLHGLTLGFEARF